MNAGRNLGDQMRADAALACEWEVWQAFAQPSRRPVDPSR